jgi:hypothetical protein
MFCEQHEIGQRTCTGPGKRRAWSRTGRLFVTSQIHNRAAPQRRSRRARRLYGPDCFHRLALVVSDTQTPVIHLRFLVGPPDDNHAVAVVITGVVDDGHRTKRVELPDLHDESIVLGDVKEVDLVHRLGPYLDGQYFSYRNTATKAASESSPSCWPAGNVLADKARRGRSRSK